MDTPRHIRGTELVLDAFGYWPAFHDARVSDVRVGGGVVSFTIRAFEMTKETDERGYFRLTKHHDVRLRFEDVVDGSLPERNDTLMRLVVEDELDGDGRFLVDVDSVLGSDHGGTFRARSGVVVAVVPTTGD